MKISKFTVNPFGENTYILWDPKTLEAAIIDPGMRTQSEIQAVDDFIANNNLKVKMMLFTHLHMDHVWGHEHVAEKYGVKHSASIDELPLGESLVLQAKSFGLKAQIAPIDRIEDLPDGEILMIGEEPLEVRKISGHSPGGLVFYAPESGFVVTGDTLFEGSIGRTDLYGGNLDSLVSGIKEKLLTLPGDTLVCPGHGPTTTIEAEKNNYYLR